MVDDFAHVVAALDLVLDFAEDLADLVLNGVGIRGLLLEALEVGEEIVIDEVAQIVPGQSPIVIELPV